MRTAPAEIAARVDAVLASEPDHVRELRELDRTASDHATGERLTLRSMARPAYPALLVAGLLMVVEAGALQLGPLLIQRAIDRGILGGSREEVVRAAVLFVLAGVVAIGASAWRTWLTGRVGLRLTTELRLRLFRHLQRLSLGWLRSERTGRLLARLTSDVDSLTQLLQDGIANLAVQALTLVAVTVILLRLHLQLALLLMLCIIPLMVGLSLWFRRASAQAHGTARERIADVLADLQENLLGARIITAVGRAPRNASRHREHVARYRDAELEVARLQSIYTPSVDAIANGGQLVVLGVGGALVLRGSLQVGELTAFLLYLGSFFAPIQQLVNFHSIYQRGMASSRKIADVLAATPTVTEQVDAPELRVTSGAFTLESVTYAYVDGVPVLDDVSMTVPGGVTLAVVGRTGAGKSTLARLLTREFDPDAGRVTVDGTDARDVTLPSLRRNVLMVPQDAFLFRGSLADNLTLGVLEADDELLHAACERVGLGRVLRRVGGLHCPMTRAVSAGERQLVALARALLFDPAVLVLDESTSNLDLATQAMVEEAVAATLRGRTAVVIAHRLSTAIAADLVAVLEHGRLVEFGPPVQLLGRADGHFTRMYEDWEVATA